MLYFVVLAIIIAVLYFLYKKTKVLINFDDLVLDDTDEAEDIIIEACIRFNAQVDLNCENGTWVMKVNENVGIGDTPFQAYVDLQNNINKNFTE